MQRTAAFVGFDSLCDEGPVREALQACIEEEGREELQLGVYERAALRRRATAHGYTTLKAKHRHELARKRRRLEDELGAGLETVDQAQNCDAVDEFLELEASGWKGRGARPARTRSMPSVSSAPAPALARSERRRVAMACNVRAGEGVFCLKIAFDERWRRYSPGAQLMLDHVPWFQQESGAAWMDSCGEPSSELVNRLWPDRRRIVTLALPGRSPTGHLARTAISAAVRLRRGRAGAHSPNGAPSSSVRAWAEQASSTRRLLSGRLNSARRRPVLRASTRRPQLSPHGRVIPDTRYVAPTSRHAIVHPTHDSSRDIRWCRAGKGVLP